jgi:hypothetical protein
MERYYRGVTMKPISPVASGFKETIFAKDQPQYMPLPAIVESDGTVHTRWAMSLRERLYVLFHGSVFLSVLTFNNPLQPVKLTVKLSTSLSPLAIEAARRLTTFDEEDANPKSSYDKVIW